MLVWLFLAWCFVALLRDLGAIPQPAVIYARGTIFAILVLGVIFFRHSL